MTVFFRVSHLDNAEKGAALRSSIKCADSLVFDVDVASLSTVPGSAFAYWAPQSTLAAFAKFPPLENGHRAARQGASTVSAFRHLRLSWEVAETAIGHTREATFAGRRWLAFAKGGKYSPVYSDVYLLIDWRLDGAALKAEISEWRASRGWGYQWTATLNGHSHYLRPGLTWPLRTLSGLGMRAMPSGCVFGAKGPAVFAADDDPAELLGLLAVTTSQAFRYLVELHMTAASFEVGVIQRTAVPPLSRAAISALGNLTRRAWSLKRFLDTTSETSHAFVLPPGLLGYEALPLHPRAGGGGGRADVERELADIQAEIDARVFALYEIGGEDRAVIEGSMARGSADVSGGDRADDESASDADTLEDDESSSELTTDTVTKFSWLVGVTFGRFDPRLATGERAIPPEPDPFDPLPARSPGMWPEDERPATAPPDIMVDDPGHDHDIRSLVASAAARTGWPDPDDLRRWLAREFFPLHIRMYSKSRRKAPIYWQLATPSASYSVWLYLHAFTKDTLFRVQNDYVAPKLAHEVRKLESMQGADTAAERKSLAAQETFVEELCAFLDEVKRVAPLWNPDLDDGVIINFSLLWRLVPQHKPWQKELKATWDALCAGEYDWAHLAMHLWPERVVPKCAKDRSLAIAHGLEEVFWVEGSDGKWTARRTPTTPVAELIRERTSPAVRDALERLLKAPAPSTGGTKKKAARKQAVRKASNGGGGV